MAAIAEAWITPLLQPLLQLLLPWHSQPLGQGHVRGQGPSPSRPLGPRLSHAPGHPQPVWLSRAQRGHSVCLWVLAEAGEEAEVVRVV